MQPTWEPHTKHGHLTTQSDLPNSVFAFPRERKEPLTDAQHVRSAIARFNQVIGVTDEERDLAFANIQKSRRLLRRRVSSGTIVARPRLVAICSQSPLDHEAIRTFGLHPRNTGDKATASAPRTSSELHRAAFPSRCNRWLTSTASASAVSASPLPVVRQRPIGKRALLPSHTVTRICARWCAPCKCSARNAVTLSATHPGASKRRQLRPHDRRMIEPGTRARQSDPRASKAPPGASPTPQRSRAHQESPILTKRHTSPRRHRASAPPLRQTPNSRAASSTQLSYTQTLRPIGERS